MPRLLSLLCAAVAAVPLAVSSLAGSFDPPIGLDVAWSSKKIATSEVTNSTLRYVQNSGICETTPGVTTYSGYINVAPSNSNVSSNLWFWFFEARNNPEKAPFALWLNGGPGCSSMIGLFQEHGPCKVTEDGNSTYLNPYSWNEYANMIYIDQPVGTGFSYGADDVNTTWEAARPVWEFFQILFSSDQFSTYESREFGFWTESYGGHYGPVFSNFFEEQNAKIADGTLKGEQIELKALGMNDPWIDPLEQAVSYYYFAQEKYNHYFNIVNSTVLAQAKEAVYGKNGCLELEQKCYETGTDAACHKADDYCENFVFAPLIGNQDPYYFLNSYPDPFPSESYVRYLHKPEVVKAIGAEHRYHECPNAPYEKFVPSGDDARTTGPALAKILNTGLRTLLWAGDVDYICNWLGVYRVLNNLTAYDHNAAFRDAPWNALSYNGSVWGTYKETGNMSFVKVFGAGHEIPAYKPEIALVLFKQTMQLEPVSSGNSSS